MDLSCSFIIRVYAIILNESSEVLITDEFRMNQQMTKFPGGGLVYGEGTIDCLIREIKEECNNQKIKNIQHFYTTDFYQKALFFDEKQLISIYYTAALEEPVCFKISEKPFDFDPAKNEFQSFRWVKIGALNEHELSFPIDRFVLGKLKLSYT